MLSEIQQTTQQTTQVVTQPKSLPNTNKIAREILQISKNLERRFINLGIKERYFDLFLQILSSKLNAENGRYENMLSFYQKLESLNLPNTEQYKTMEDYAEEIAQLYKRI